MFKAGVGNRTKQLGAKEKLTETRRVDTNIRIPTRRSVVKEKKDSTVSELQ
jgi:hypothetical protein